MRHPRTAVAAMGLSAAALVGLVLGGYALYRPGSSQ